jgi:DNA repair protein RadC
MTAFTLNESTGMYQINGPVTQGEILDQAQEILHNTLVRSDMEVFTEPSTVRSFLKIALATMQREIFACLFLDNRHRLIQYEELFQGTIDGASVHPREVVKAALHHNAAAVILAHNHPSGVADPSDADKRITSRLKDALNLVDIRVLDHFVIGEGEPVSFAEEGFL